MRKGGAAGWLADEKHARTQSRHLCPHTGDFNHLQSDAHQQKGARTRNHVFATQELGARLDTKENKKQAGNGERKTPPASLFLSRSSRSLRLLPDPQHSPHQSLRPRVEREKHLYNCVVVFTQHCSRNHSSFPLFWSGGRRLTASLTRNTTINRNDISPTNIIRMVSALFRTHYSQPKMVSAGSVLRGHHQSLF